MTLNRNRVDDVKEHVEDNLPDRPATDLNRTQRIPRSQTGSVETQGELPSPRIRIHSPNDSVKWTRKPRQKSNECVARNRRKMPKTETHPAEHLQHPTPLSRLRKNWTGSSRDSLNIRVSSECRLHPGTSNHSNPTCGQKSVSVSRLSGGTVFRALEYRNG